VGCDHDTPAFAVASIRRWWMAMGRRAYPHTNELFITADTGGSNVSGTASNIASSVTSHRTGVVSR
jgi:hypothetical protein